ncbi:MULTISPECIES: hypothetical protein, partial [unclassified Streptomyces]|uniref:hypothetical protein n=1 Tax=unclassified Streptomyces TaxID=2593676 RepID=UPI0036A47C30
MFDPAEETESAKANSYPGSPLQRVAEKEIGSAKLETKEAPGGPGNRNEGSVRTLRTQQRAKNQRQ